jgi:hypothetical protein
MSRRTLFLFIALSFLSACAIQPKSGGAFPAADVKGIRDIGDGPFLLDFLAIKAGTEDRVVLEFDLRKRGHQFKRMLLKIPVDNIDEGGDAGVIDVYTFVGDGVVGVTDFDAGTRIARVTAGKDRNLRVNVTSAVKAAMEAGDRFIGFRLSTKGADRYFLGWIADLRDPVLRVRWGD